MASAREEWKKTHLIRYQIKLNKKTDADIIDYLKGKRYSTEFKAAIRQYMKSKTAE